MQRGVFVRLRAPPALRKAAPARVVRPALRVHRRVGSDWARARVPRAGLRAARALRLWAPVHPAFVRPLPARSALHQYHEPRAHTAPRIRGRAYGLGVGARESHSLESTKKIGISLREFIDQWMPGSLCLSAFKVENFTSELKPWDCWPISANLGKPRPWSTKHNKYGVRTRHLVQRLGTKTCLGKKKIDSGMTISGVPGPCEEKEET
ncbi:hypothetical protein FB451DRAFT_1179567 [Mycena latifolia]|nr:hypothetical protein FB451DRAFT_1179567 [Mycena latifolia]